MIDPGELAWVLENEELVKQLGKQLGSAAYGAMNGVLKQNTAEMEKYTEN